MKNKTIITIGILLIIALGGLFLNRSGSVAEPAIAATIYKSSTCGCCGVYATYLEKEGYEVKVENVNDLTSTKQRFGIPPELESCHTLAIGDYVVEGHIPEAAISKLLAEKPSIQGIGLPGMPSGSPGMPGPKLQDFVIHEINHGGMMGDIFTTI